MPTPIELTLSSLLPTVSFLPPELIALSTSLLAQSRSKAASLKAEEEIGRTYACCHIACQRLGHKLALEIAKPAPPVKPKVYDKLHTYFNSVLKTTTTPRTPSRKRRTVDKLQHEDPPKPSRGAGTALVTPTKVTTPTRKRGESAMQDEMDEYPVVHPNPLIRHLCKAFDAPEAAPHVIAGVTSALLSTNGNCSTDPAKKRKLSTPVSPDEMVTTDKIPALVLTLFSAVYGKMYGKESAADSGFCLKAIYVARKWCKEHAEGVGIAFDENGDMTEDIKDFNERALGSWLDMEWYQNVPVLDATTDDENDEDEGDAVNGAVAPVKQSAKTPLRRKEKHGKFENNDLCAAGLLPGLGTMFQPTIDWLSDERRADYVRWKHDILHKAAIIEQQG